LEYVDRRAYIRRPRWIAADTRIGEYTFINRGAWICPRVSIGAYCLLAPDVAICGGDHVIDKPGLYILHAGRPDCPPTVLGDDVWVGYRAIIKAGVQVGDGAVVAMGSVVTNDVPPGAIVAGNPAKIIRMRFNQKELEGHLMFLRAARGARV